MSRFGFPLQRCKCTGVCPVEVVCGSMWWWVRRSWEKKACLVWGRWRGKILLLSSGTGEGSEKPEQFLDVHGDRTRGNGTKLQQGKFCLDAGKWKGRTNRHYMSISVAGDIPWATCWAAVFKLTLCWAGNWTSYLNRLLWICIILWFLFN